jgi:hypothetical protein
MTSSIGIKRNQFASTPRNRNLIRRYFMTRFKLPRLMFALGLLAPLCSNAADYCISTNGGFGHGGSSFIGKGFVLPTPGRCLPWSGFVKTASTVLAVSTGTGCRSTDGKVFELTVFSTAPSYLGSGFVGSDHIKFCPSGSATCPFGGGVGVGTFSNGAARSQTCVAALYTIPSTHD